jgi:hypothetical protein
MSRTPQNVARSWAPSVCVLCTVVPGHGVLAEVVAQFTVSVTADSRGGAVTWRATKSHPEWLRVPTTITFLFYNETRSTDRVSATELFSLALHSL